MPVGQGNTSFIAETCAAPGTGTLETNQNTKGLTQHGCFSEEDTPNSSAMLVQELPGAQRVQLVAAGYDGYDANVTEIGPQEYSVTLHVGNTLRIAPVPANCQSVETAPIAPNTSQFQFRSRQRMVVTTGQDPNAYTSTCLLTAVGIGITEVTVTSFRNVNAAFAGAEPSGTEGTQCSLIVRVVA